MENLIFSLNNTLPIFAVMLLGIIAREKGILNDDYVARANKFNFYTGMPVLLFMGMYGKDIKSGITWEFMGVLLVCLAIMFILSCVAANVFIKHRVMRGAFAQGIFRGNTALIGIAIINNMYGASPAAAAGVACVVPLYNIGAVIMLNVYPAKHVHHKKPLADIVKGIITNPLIIGTVLGTLAAYFEFTLPEIAERSLGYLSDMAMGTALVCIGASMSFDEYKRRRGPAFLAAFIKLIVFPAMLLPLAIIAGCREDMLMAIYIAVGSPAAVNSYIMARSMNHDSDLASAIIVITSLLGAVSMTLWIFVLRTYGLV